MPLGVSSRQMRVMKDTTKSITDMPSRCRFSARGGTSFSDLARSFLAFLCVDEREALGLACAFLETSSEGNVSGGVSSGAVSGGGVSGADSPSPCEKDIAIRGKLMVNTLPQG